MTQTEAKRFFVDKVVAQAQSEGMPLSDAEREMLARSLSVDIQTNRRAEGEWKQARRVLHEGDHYI